MKMCCGMGCSFNRKSICPGKYDLRIGMMDHSTQKIGTLQAPLVIDAAHAAK
jgi:hypothetical protein